MTMSTPCSDSIHFSSVDNSFKYIPVSYQDTLLSGTSFYSYSSPIALPLGDGALIGGLGSSSGSVEEVIVSNSSTTELLSTPSGKPLHFPARPPAAMIPAINSCAREQARSRRAQHTRAAQRRPRSGPAPSSLQPGW